MEHYVYLSSDQVHHNDFIVQLPKRLHFPGSWECALIEATALKTPPPLGIYMTANFVDTSILNGRHYNILRCLVGKQFLPTSQRIYVPVTVTDLDRVNIRLISQTGILWTPKLTGSSTQGTRVLVHFRQKNGRHHRALQR